MEWRVRKGEREKVEEWSMRMEKQGKGDEQAGEKMRTSKGEREAEDELAGKGDSESHQANHTRPNIPEGFISARKEEESIEHLT